MKDLRYKRIKSRSLVHVQDFDPYSIELDPTEKTIRLIAQLLVLSLIIFIGWSIIILVLI